MTQDQILTFAVIGITVVLFIWNKWRFDIIALMSLFAAVVVGIVPVKEAFSGFADPVVVTVACILVLSAAISRSGFIEIPIRILSRFEGMPNMQVFVLCAMIVVTGAFMNNIGALAIFLPIAISFARKIGRNVSEFLMPMAFASLLSGLLTLIGTPPNLMISNIRENFTGEQYQMFDFTPVGILLCLFGTIYLAFSWKLVPKDRRGAPLPEDRFSIEDYVSEINVDEGSTFIDKTIREIEQMVEGDISITGILRSGYRNLAPSGLLKVRQSDVLIVKGDSDALQNLVDTGKVSLIGSKEIKDEDFTSEEVGTIEAVVTSGSDLIGQTVKELRLRSRFGVNLLAVRQGGQGRQQRLSNIRFAEGDVIVLQGDIGTLGQIVQDLGCLPLAERNLQLGRPKFMYMPVVIMGICVLLAVTGTMPLAVSFLGGVLALVLLKIMRPTEIYQSIDITVVVLLGALIPVTQAMQDTGGAELIAHAVSSLTDGLPMIGVVGIVLISTMVVTPFLNNGATVLLMAPIAANLGQNMGISVDAMLMAVAIGASSDFLTPVGHQSNTLVMGPGGYKFTDYWRLGLPLSLLIIIGGVPMIAWIWG